MISRTCGRRKSKRWQRERIVSGILCGSVVARTNTTCGGGSSRVLSRALNASLVSMWTSSMMYTLKRPCDGREGDLVAQIADVVDAAVGGGVHLDHVERGAGGDGHAVAAGAAGRGGRLARPAASASVPTQLSALARIARGAGLAGAARARRRRRRERRRRSRPRCAASAPRGPGRPARSNVCGRYLR